MEEQPAEVEVSGTEEGPEVEQVFVDEPSLEKEGILSEPNGDRDQSPMPSLETSPFSLLATISCPRLTICAEMVWVRGVGGGVMGDG